MNRNTKKGFTIVELIIVIAVIAVLAAVLIPTFSNLINQAQQAKDTALVSDLNKGLKMSGKNFDTMHDALTAVEENVGINVAKISAVATDSKILWDSVNQCFVYLKGGETTPTYIPDSKTTDVKGDYDYWMISDKDADVKADKYSIYWNGSNLETITATTGFDVGEKNVAKILYQRADDAAAREVTIRTNGGELEVAAATDTLKRYGKIDSVEITAIAPQSYHEFGTVYGDISVKSGNVVIENGASANSVVLAGANAMTKIESGSNVSMVVATNKDYYAKVTNNNSATKVDNTLILTEVADSALFAGGNGTKELPFIIASEKQLRNLEKLSATDVSYIKLVADIEMNLSVTDKTISTLCPQITISKSIDLDMNGKSIKPSTSSISDDFGKADPLLFALIDGTLTIHGNGTINCECGNNQVYGINIKGENAKVVVKDGNFYGAITAIQVKTGTLEIEGGVFDMAPTCKSQVPGYAKYVINAIDSNYKDGTAKIIVKGGTFFEFDPSNNPEGEDTTYVADGYTVKKVKEGGFSYYVIEKSK